MWPKGSTWVLTGTASAGQGPLHPPVDAVAPARTLTGRVGLSQPLACVVTLEAAVCGPSIWRSRAQAVGLGGEPGGRVEGVEPVELLPGRVGAARRANTTARKSCVSG